MTMASIVLRAAASRLYGASLTGAEPLGNSANLVWAADAQGRPLIVRASPHSCDKERHVAFELDWLHHLAGSMTGVADVVPSRGGKLYETVDGEGTPFILCAFERAPGELVSPDDPARWNDALFASMGEVMGRMHRVTEEYVTGRDIGAVQPWHRWFLSEPEYAATMDGEVAAMYKRLVAAMDTLPKSPGDWGILHTDVHHLNFHVQEGAITLFDFDDCGVGAYGLDVASSCFFCVNTIDYRDAAGRDALAGRFLRAFLQGYRSHRAFGVEQVAQIDLFMRFRRLCLYRFIRHLFGDGQDHPYADYAAFLRLQTLADTPFVNLDYASLA